MRAQMQLTNSASTVFGWLIDQERRLHLGLQLTLLRRALRSAYARFARGNRELSASLFDAHFVETRVAPLLADALERDVRLTADAIAEAWFASCKAPGSTLDGADLRSIRAAAAELLAGVEEELRAGREPRAPEPAAAPAPAARGDSAGLFAAAVRANSNLELDWLWLYTYVSGSYERTYCLQKALEIDPHSEMARRELAASAAEDSAAPLVLSAEA